MKHLLLILAVVGMCLSGARADDITRLPGIKEMFVMKALPDEFPSETSSRLVIVRTRDRLAAEGKLTPQAQVVLLNEMNR